MDGLTEDDLELLEPHPDIYALFVHYNALYFGQRLGACSVEWSSARMTLCGGVCEFRPGGGCRIKLSEPLLKLRPSRDLKMVLLHEMIHADMMLQGIRDDDPGGHGTRFKAAMGAINASTAPDHQRPAAGYGITTTHSMLAEVEHYRQHHWRCERCGNVVKRAMNRPPQEADCRAHAGAACRDPACRFHMHQRHCGGTWVKVKEPEGFGQKKKKGGSKAAAAAGEGSAGAAASRADGAPVPAKRPKKSSGGAAAAVAAAAAGRPITDFFHPPSPSRTAGAAAGGTGGGRQGPTSSSSAEGVLPALQAVGNLGAAASAGPLGGGSSQAGASQAQQPAAKPTPAAEPPPEERRRLLAEAAMRRLGVGAAPTSSTQQRPQQKQQPPPRQPPPQQPPPEQPQAGTGPRTSSSSSAAAAAAAGRQQAPTDPAGLPSPGGDVIDLLGSSDEDGDGCGLPLPERLQQRQEQQQSSGAEQRSTSSPPPAGADSAVASGAAGGEAALLACPICGQQWAATDLSNAQLNAHIDECLNSSYVDG